MLSLLSGPFFLLLYKAWHHILQSRNGIVPREETQYRILISDTRTTLHLEDEWKELKNLAFFTVFVVLLYLSFIFVTLSLPFPPEEEEPTQTTQTKSQEMVNWDRDTVVRDGYLYKIENIPLYLKAENQKREFLQNEEEGISFKEVVLLRLPSEGVVLTRRWILQSEVLSVLRQIYESEKEDCICPVFLGLTGNLSFLLYQEKEWIIMYDPFISWHPRDAQLVKRRIVFREESKFNGFLEELHRRELYQQYDKFTVTFYSPSNTGNIRQRISLPLQGREAVCFTFCQNQPLVSL